jgi:ATP-binding cassette subfamily E protein 1
MGKICIEVTPVDKMAKISEELCIGCGICVKKCPFDAISIINLPSNLEKDTTHRYSANSFKLHRLPVPRQGVVLGLVGTNGIGKSTALKILSGKLQPNLGKFTNPPSWQEVVTNFRGSELQNYFTKIVENNLKPCIKPQYVDQIPKAIKGTVSDMLDRKDELGVQAQVCDQFDLSAVRDRNVEDLSGGELQRFACAVVCIQRADIYMFDEPSSYLDVKQRLKAAGAIRDLLNEDRYVIVVEHDLSVLDYLSDFICCLYGVPGAYGVVTLPSGVREGINIFLDGFVPSENLRFRETSLTFKLAESADMDEIKRMRRYSYPNMTKKMGAFQLDVQNGEFTDSEIIVMLGENGTGKTTFIRLMAGHLAPDSGGKQPVMSWQ